jgi:hypothetical protein
MGGERSDLYSFFGGDSDNQENQQAIARSDAKAAQLVQGFSDIQLVGATMARLAAENGNSYESRVSHCRLYQPGPEIPTAYGPW